MTSNKPLPTTYQPEPEDMVNQPFHYTASRIECIDAMQAMLSPEEFIGYLRGNIFKYQWRYRHKNLREDLEKSQWYLTKLIALTDSKGASHGASIPREDQSSDLERG